MRERLRVRSFTANKSLTMPTTTITSIHTVAIAVANQDRALTFYVDTLGFETRMDAPIGPGMRWIEVAPPGADITIALTAAPDNDGRYRHGNPPYFHRR